MTIVIGTIAIVAAVIVVGVIVDRKIGIVPRPEELRDAQKPRTASYAAGEAPSSAIRATTERLANLCASRRCTACREHATCESDDRVRYDDRELLVLRFRCGKCGATQALYIAPG
jgi:hypothetical protein